MKTIKKTSIKGQYGKYTLADGKMFHGYEVYENGDIRMQWFMAGMTGLQDECEGINMLINWFADFILQRKIKFAEHRRHYWRDIISELKIIDKTYDEDKFIYSFDHSTGFITKTEKPAPKPETEPNTDAVRDVKGKVAG